MDQKRGNATGTRQGASKTSVASRQLGNNVARKYGSEVSLTPSQAKHNAENPRKSPLDALSRLNHRQDPFQRRSGLQDVDDSFLASNAFVRPSRVRHTGLDGNMPVAGNAANATSAAVAPLRAASGQEAPQMQMQYQQQQQQPPQSTQMPQQAMQPSVTNTTSSQLPMQQQQQQPMATQQQQQLPPAAVMPNQQAVPQQQQQQQQPQQYMQPPAAGQPTRHDPYPSGRAHVQHQQMTYEQQQQQQQPTQQDALAQSQAQAQQQQPPAQLSPRKFQQQQQQQGYAGQPTAAGGAPAAAEMCTTCPNCQTTIYLVRTPEMGHGDGGMPMQ